MPSLRRRGGSAASLTYEKTGGYASGGTPLTSLPVVPGGPGPGAITGEPEDETMPAHRVDGFSPSALVYGLDGPIGTPGPIYLDNETGKPMWLTVLTGHDGHESLVPVGRASFGALGLVVPYAKETVVNAPNVYADGPLSSEDAEVLYAYYEMDSDTVR